MSSSHRPAAPLAFSAEVLAASTVIATCGACNTSRDMLAEVTSFLMEGIYLTAEAAGILAVEAAKGLNMVREEGTKVGHQIGKETFDFLSGGATMGASMIGDISQGVKGELIHGVKEGGRLFSMMVGGAEVMFERCGTAIVGRFVDEEQEAIDRELTQRIADAYQMIMKQVGEISVGKDPLMVAHIEAMETTRQSLVAIKAEQEAINIQLESLKEERAKVQASLRELDEEMEESLKKLLTEANEAFKQSVSEINRKIMNTEKAHAKLKKRNEDELSQSLAQQEKLEQLELRKDQSRQFVDMHNSRVKEHTTREIQRIVSEHGLDDPTIELSEGENNLIRIHIEE